MKHIPIEISAREKYQITEEYFIPSKENYRYFTPVPRDTELWDELYAKRSACERSFKREKEDYKLNATRTRGKKMWTIRVALACMCQHIDALIFYFQRRACSNRLIFSHFGKGVFHNHR